jgi:hypothetical protein
LWDKVEVKGKVEVKVEVKVEFIVSLPYFPRFL